MNTVKILHISDLHLDCAFSNLSLDTAKIRKQELKLSFENIFNVCPDADIVLMCGDIFDNANFLKGTLDFVISVFKRYPEKTFFIIGGNHDNINSPAIKYISDMNLDNVIVFSGKAEYMELDDLKVRVYGMSFYDKTHYSSMINDFSVIDDDYINILMLHGEIASSCFDSKYNPIMPEQIQNSWFDYIALGHTHEFSGIKKLGRTFYSYCGTHEGHGFDELGEKGVVYGDVGKDICNLKFVKTCLREYHVIDIDVSDLYTVEEIINTVREKINDNDIYKIVLKGTLNENIIIDSDVLESQLKTFYLKVINETQKAYNLDELAMLKNFKGYIANTVLLEAKEADEKDIDVIFSASDYLFDLLDNGGVKH